MSKPADIRSDNLSKIVEQLTLNTDLSRSDLADLLGISRATVSAIIGQLISDGLVSELHQLPAGPKGGRRKTILQLNHLSHIAVGLEIDEESCKGMVVGLPNVPIKHIEVSVTDPTINAIVELIVDVSELLLQDYPTSYVMGYGVAISGVVDVEQGIIRFTTHFDWQDVPLRTLLEKRLKRPVIVIDRPKAAMMGEKWYGIARDANDVVYCHIGSGIGSALLIGGHLHMGFTNTAGEIGHVMIDPTGPRCRCGNRGCLEILASGRAIAARAVEKLNSETDSSILRNWTGGALDTITAKMIQDAAAEGDSLALEVIEETGSHVGIAIASVINILNPEMVLIGGPIARFGAPFFEAIKLTVDQRALDISKAAVQILPPQLDADAEQVGAAALVIQETFGLGESSLLEINNRRQKVVK